MASVRSFDRRGGACCGREAAFGSAVNTLSEVCAVIGLAQFVMRGRWQAASTATGFALLGILFPLLGMVASLLSGAAVGLVTLRAGGAAGGQVILIGSLFLTIFASAVFGHTGLGVVLGASFWAPIWLTALVLRYSIDLRAAVLAAMTLGAVTLFAVHLGVADLTSRWQALLHTLLLPLQQERMAQSQQIVHAIDQLAQVMTGLLIAGVVLGTILTLFLARYWQAQLYNPGGFKTEVAQLQLGRAVGVLTLLVLGITATLQSALSFELVLVLLTGLFIQGVLIIHVLNERLRYSSGWLVLFYFFLVIAFPQVGSLLAAIGLIDCFANLRRRIGQSGGN